EGLRAAVTNDPTLNDLPRRTEANLFVQWTFDDDMDPSNGDPDYQFGAGPVVATTDGVTSLQALQTVSVPDVHVYKPDPQLNQHNAAHGDMVSGRFCYNADPAVSEDATYADASVCGQQQRGAGAYARNDFNPSAAGDYAAVNNTAFLVRLRRSNEFQDAA